MAKDKTPTERYIEEVNATRGLFMSTLMTVSLDVQMMYVKEGMTHDERVALKAVGQAVDTIRAQMRKHIPPLQAAEDY